ncbi:polysaccharide pyruvyl transferase family protein [Candidatus Bipolaricaulota bacterium]|nr:polysaccharide pyruvyl transferase family protein [Candidatus Bipolaricaulota bacterium]
MKRGMIVITGYYGHGNLGDEALRKAAVEALRKAGVEPLVIAGRARLDPCRVTTALQKSAALVLGGGGLLQNRTSARSLYYYLGLIALARALRRPVFLIGQGLGPIDGRLARSLTRRVLARVDYLGVRDRASRELAARLGIAAVLDGDLYFLNPPLPEPRPQREPRRIGVALSGRSVEEREEDWARFLAALPGDREIALIPFFPGEDLAAARRLAGMLPHARVEVPGSVAAAQGLIGGLDLLIASRLHPLEFGLRAGVPLIAVAADPKIAAFVAEVAACDGPEIPCVESPRPDDAAALLRDPPPPERFVAAYAALHARTQAGFARFLTALREKIGGDDE